MKKTGDRILNPVKMCTVIVRRLNLHPKSANAAKKIFICYCYQRSGIIFQTQVLQHMCSVATLIEDKLYFTKHGIGTRSIRTSAAMGWYLENKYPTRIDLMGRWK